MLRVVEKGLHGSGLLGLEMSVTFTFFACEIV